jgi:hypothetical protein
MANNQERAGSNLEPGYSNRFTSRWYNPATELSPEHMAHAQRAHERIMEREAQRYRDGANVREHFARMAAEEAEPVTNKFLYCRLVNNEKRKIEVSLGRDDISLPYLIRHADHASRTATAATETKEWVLRTCIAAEARRIAERNEHPNEHDSDSDSDGDGYGHIDMGGIPHRPSAAEIAATKYPFIDALPFCDAMTAGFDIDFEATMNQRFHPAPWCYCPLGQSMRPWRRIFDLSETAVCTGHGGPFFARHFQDHLRTYARPRNPHERCQSHDIVDYYLSRLYPRCPNFIHRDPET